MKNPGSSPCSIEKKNIRKQCDVVSKDHVDSGKISKKHHHHHPKEGEKHHHHHHNDEKNKDHHHHHHLAPQDRVDPKQLFVHEHDDHYHAHEHYHGGEENVLITTIGLVIHSLADGTALGASLYCTQI
jgi:hypothetical protein